LHASGLGEERCDGRGQERLPVADPDDERALPPRADEEIRIGPSLVNLKKHTVMRSRRSQPLSFYEVELVKLLWERKEQPVSRDEILDKIWGIEAYPSNRTVDNFIVKLRKKIEDDGKEPRHILTVYGYGYKLVP